MSFSIEFLRNNSEDNKINKSLSSITTLSGNLKNECSIINPTIIVEGSIDTFKNCNYMRISNFGRSYFVTNIRSLRNNLVEISGKVDVLQSFASSILSNSAIIKRQETDWNLYIDDGSLHLYANPIITTHTFPNGFGQNEFLLAVAGG